MVYSTGRRTSPFPYGPGRLGLVVATVASLVAWLLAAGGLVGVISFAPTLEWDQLLALIVLCGAPQGALGATRNVQATRRIRAALPSGLFERRLHGSPDAIGN